MAKSLVPIRVKIRRSSETGRLLHKYPDFNQIDANTRKNMDWAEYLDLHGIGWHYDKICGFDEKDTYNPDPEVWYGCTAVPREFAEEAIISFPDDVEILSEDDFEIFYDTRAHVQESEEIYSLEIMQSIKVKQQLRGKLTQSDKDALDPDKPNPGINKNHNKTWALYKAKKNISIDGP